MKTAAAMSSRDEDVIEIRTPPIVRRMPPLAATSAAAAMSDTPIASRTVAQGGSGGFRS